MFSAKKLLSILVSVLIVGMIFASTSAMARPLELNLSLITPPKHLRNPAKRG